MLCFLIFSLHCFCTFITSIYTWVLGGLVRPEYVLEFRILEKLLFFFLEWHLVMWGVNTIFNIHFLIKIFNIDFASYYCCHMHLFHTWMTRITSLNPQNEWISCYFIRPDSLFPSFHLILKEFLEDRLQKALPRSNCAAWLFRSNLFSYMWFIKIFLMAIIETWSNP